MQLTLFIRNYQRTRSANITVHLEAEGQDDFVVAGLRKGWSDTDSPSGHWRKDSLAADTSRMRILEANIRVVDGRRTLPQPSGDTQKANLSGSLTSELTNDVLLFQKWVVCMSRIRRNTMWIILFLYCRNNGILLMIGNNVGWASAPQYRAAKDSVSISKTRAVKYSHKTKAWLISNFT